jgi:hypothetical protein
MHEIKTGAYQGKEPFRLSTPGYSPGITHKHQTVLERPAKDKQTL